jgi:methylenetetrahydrofolate dehydrogenase (NADP+) / methenyltetrahydrofolate cyclohydrolase
VTARRLDGLALAADLNERSAAEVGGLRRAGRPAPGLAVVLVGENPASAVYVRSKQRACEAVGLRSTLHRLPAAAREQDLLSLIETLNRDPETDGILVQLPLPPGIDSARILERVDPLKDVDGFHPVNAGALAQGRPRLVPCTPAGILELLRREAVPLAGARAVVLGRSIIVGRPMALLLLSEDATVTVAHSRSRDLAAICREADVLIAAVGRPGLVTEEFVRPGATVIDVGMNRVTDRALADDLVGPGSPRLAEWDRKPSLLVGDVHPRRVEPVAGALTPVPGGVGPLTVAMLLRNTLAAHRARHGGPA